MRDRIVEEFVAWKDRGVLKLGYPESSILICLVVSNIYFSIMYGMSSSQLTNSYFSEG
jgi:hypothetical protein